MAGTKQRFSGFNQRRQCGDDGLRMLVIGGPPVRGRWRHAQRLERITDSIIRRLAEDKVADYAFG